jgi:hypothetical protein
MYYAAAIKDELAFLAATLKPMLARRRTLEAELTHGPHPRRRRSGPRARGRRSPRAPAPSRG